MWQMRCTKWSPWWKPEEEAPIAIDWISFLDLPPNFIGKEFVFYLARVVSIPLYVDMATQNCTRPSCAKVKVEVNLLANVPQGTKIIEEGDESGLEESKWIKIKYEYVPKYCISCKKQGNDEQECQVIHPELHKIFEDDVEDQGRGKEVVRNTANSTKVLSS